MFGPIFPISLIFTTKKTKIDFRDKSIDLNEHANFPLFQLTNALILTVSSGVSASSSVSQDQEASCENFYSVSVALSSQMLYINVMNYLLSIIIFY